VAAIPWFYTVIEEAQVGDWRFKFRALEIKADEQQEIIKSLVIYSMSESIYQKLRSWYQWKGGEYLYSPGGEHEDTNRREFYYLRDNGYIERNGDGFLSFGPDLNGRDIGPMVKLTPVGKFLVEEREKLLAEEKEKRSERTENG
jgi:hypothetical protein